MNTDKFKKTIRACFTGYIVQAIINNFAPLLFLTFNREYDIPLSQITVLITINFTLQIIVDITSVFYVDKIGYRISMVIAHFLSALGLVLLALLPNIMPKPFTGIIISVVLYAIGGGLLEVLVSPVLDGCPAKNKSGAMSILHSFYCWGHVGVVLISTAFFSVFGIENWRYLAILWAIVPLVNAIIFMHVPIVTPHENGRTMTFRELVSEKMFWVFVFLMFCAGACEQSVSQWASTFAEQGLNISKTAGDLLGPTMFAICMGIARSIYGKLGDKMPIANALVACSVLCAVSYLVISLSPYPLVALAGCAICGFSVGILWPGTFSLASKSIPGGTAMFALLALGGDIGCSGGPTFVGLISAISQNNLHEGILAATVFPIMLLVSVIVLIRKFDIK